MGAENNLPDSPKGNQNQVIGADTEYQSVDAGAGTGKTTTMIMDIKARIDEDDLNPSDILVLTFANEAAASIQEDINSALPAGQAFSIDVYTYHSFCFDLVQDYAYYNGLDPDLEIVTADRREQITRLLLSENDYGFADTDKWREQTPEELSRGVSNFIGNMSREDISPEDIRNVLPSEESLRKLGGMIYPIERFVEKSFSLDNDKILYFQPKHIDEIHSDLDRLQRLLKAKINQIRQLSGSETSPVIQDLTSYLETIAVSIDNLKEVMTTDKKPHKYLPTVIYQNFPYDIAGTIEQTPYGRLENVLANVKTTIQYAEIYQDYWEHLEDNGLVDFDLLIRKSQELVTDPEVGDEIRSKWQRIYCDEFQDTDQAQFDLITNLTEPNDGPNLLAIGDLDQEIYAWRGTDREGMNRLSELFDAKETNLGLNFRSKQEILDIANNISYGSLDSKELKENGRERGSYNEDDPPDRVIKIENELIETEPEKLVAKSISNLLNGGFEEVGEKKLGEIAVIIRQNQQAREIARELDRLQIPYKISGKSSTGIKPGLQTILSFLRVLANQDLEMHLRRVLIYRYRIPNGDIKTLESGEKSLYESLQEANLENFIRNKQVEQAQNHLNDLQTLKETYPLKQFFDKFLTKTNIEWFLRTGERKDIEQIQDYIESFDPNEPLTLLSEEFIDRLRNELSSGSASSRFSIGEKSDNLVDIMTVHQAKGLEFNTVLMPFLSEKGWTVSNDHAEKISQYRLITQYLQDEIPSLFTSDFSSQLEEEEWRVFHVGITRAEEHLFLMGSGYDYAPRDEVDPLDINRILPRGDAEVEGIEWKAEGRRLDLWKQINNAFDEVQETYPESVADYTSQMASDTSTNPGKILYYTQDEDSQEELSTGEALEISHKLGKLMRQDKLLQLGDAAAILSKDARGYEYPQDRNLTASTPETTRFPPKTLEQDSGIKIPLTHSYSALETYIQCSRKHYLDYVVRAFDDFEQVDQSESGNPRVAGTIFHDIAEEAFYRDYQTQSEWSNAAKRITTARDEEKALPGVLESIENYFGAKSPKFSELVADWPMIAAEYPFKLERVDDVSGSFIGFIDSIRQAPNGDTVLLDYKRVAETISSSQAKQLRMYLEACEEDDVLDVDLVGYVYVGTATEDQGRVNLFEPSELPDWDELVETMTELDDPNFAEYNPGPHCKFCSHQSLGCADLNYANSDD